MKNVFEINFDSLVGPTHNYSGLSEDNIASHKNEGLSSNPKQAALQGLEKMKFLADLGLKQAVFPPHPRPLISALKHFGFKGSDEDILRAAQQADPHLLSAVSSASYMWAANAATVTPSLDVLDKKLHITPANLVTSFHRTIEASETAQIFKSIFKNSSLFTIHSSLFSSASLADEGAANHTRLCPKHGVQGLHFFVYGRSGLPNTLPRPKYFYPRQTLEASQAIARFHQIPATHLFFAQQNPEAIDAGVFHNDVICVGNENILLYHEKAFLDTSEVIKNLKMTYQSLYNEELYCIEVAESKISLSEAVKTYLFNSQLITTPNNKTILITPTDCLESSSVNVFLKELVSTKSPINEVRSLDVRQSMLNGGGPACLRLRVVVTEEELAALPRGIFMDDDLFYSLTQWVKRNYREKLLPSDLGNLDLFYESRQALNELNEILELS